MSELVPQSINEFDLMMIYVQLYGFWVLLIACIGLAVAWVIWEGWLTPRESKEIRKASRKRRPIAVLVHGSGFTTIQSLNAYGDEGFADTHKKPEKGWIGYFARHQDTIDNVEVAPGKDEDVTRKAAELINELASRKTHLKYAKIPIWFGCHDKAVLTSLYNLFALKHIETMANGGAPENPKSQKSNYTLIDLHAVKSLFSKPWDASLQKTMKTMAHLRGLNDRGMLQSAQIWLWVGGFIILGLGVALIVLNNFV